MPGPAPQPTALRVVKGNPGRRPLPKNEPVFPAIADVAAPEGMTDGAREHWERLAPRLRDAGVLTDGDRDALRVLCAILDRMDRAAEIVEREGFTTGTQNGETTHPAMRILQNATDQARQYFAEFGLTPSARTRVKATTNAAEKRNDPAAKYFRD